MTKVYIPGREWGAGRREGAEEQVEAGVCRSSSSLALKRQGGRQA